MAEDKMNELPTDMELSDEDLSGVSGGTGETPPDGPGSGFQAAQEQESARDPLTPATSLSSRRPGPAVTAPTVIPTSSITPTSSA